MFHLLFELKRSNSFSVYFQELFTNLISFENDVVMLAGLFF